MHLPSWLSEAVFYEIYPQSFYDANGDGIGDFAGMTEKLDDLSALGINAIWVNPCFESPFMDAGYDITDYCRIAPRYGTNEDAIRFFNEAHRRGMRVLLDLVPGHTSDRHPWFLESKKPEKNAYTNRYIWTGNAFDYPEGFRLMSGLSDRDGNYMVNFFSSQPALNYGFENRQYDWQLPPDHPDCRATLEEMKHVMRFWLDAGCDGFRVDMAYSLVKNDPLFTGTKRLWNEVREMFEREYPDAVLLSEWSCAEQAIDAGFHMDFYLHFNSVGYNALFQTAPFDYVDKAEAAPCFFHRDGKGDVTRFLNEFLPKYRYIRGRGYMCLPTGNHDMVRYSHLRSEEELKAIAAFILLFPTVPFLYYGDEIGMRYQIGLTSKEGGYYRTGSRTPMQWSDGKNKGFSAADQTYLPVDSAPDAPTIAQQRTRAGSLWHTVRDAVALRKSDPAFGADGDFRVAYAKEGAYPFVFRRGRYVISVNPSERSERIALDGRFKTVFSTAGRTTHANGVLDAGGIDLTVFEDLAPAAGGDTN